MSNKKNIAVKVLVEVARLVLGATFVFSGFVKAVDPFGTAYKIEDYMAAFDLTSLSFLALPISGFLCMMEFLMGVFMLLGIYRKWNTRLLLLTMCFMTPLTLWLAISNPISDCGCFGDAITISNWETFFKNLVLLACSIFLLIQRERITNFFTGKTYWLAFLYLIAATAFFIWGNYIVEPIFDFRPYKIGANLPELMSVEEGKGRQEETILVYVKDGMEKEFTDQNAPWEDESWEFVRMDTKIISEGVVSSIKDFSMTELFFDREFNEIIDSEDITEEVLSDSNYVFLMVSPLLEKMSDSYLTSFEDVADYAREHHYGFYCLTASGGVDIIKFAKKYTIDFTFCNTDERTLKTMMRSNPGLVLLKNGVVINKWADISVPTEEMLKGTLPESSLGEQIDPEEKDKRNLLYVSALFILPLLLLKGFDILFFRRHPELKKKKSDKEEN